MCDLISVIVPVYKVEKYLTKCIDSILRQTYSNLEVILVNDGSPDNCPLICDNYALKDKRIKVIHQKNGGLSLARNSGLDISKGEYIVFVDSDDYIHHKMIEHLYENIIKFKADISICDFEIISEDSSDMPQNPVLDENYLIEVYSGVESLYNIYKGRLGLLTILTWNKLYKKETFKAHRFKEGKIHEDEFIVHHILDNVNKVVYSNAQLYFYLKRKNSITTEKYNIKSLNQLEAFINRVDYFKKRGYHDLYNLAITRFLNQSIDHYTTPKKYLREKKEINKKIYTMYLEAYSNIKDLKIMLTKKDEIKFKLFFINPILFTVTKKIKNLFTKRIEHFIS